jgi:iron complex transport system substrate-binding protein
VRITRSIALLLFLLVLAVACAGDDTTGTSDTTAGTSGPGGPTSVIGTTGASATFPVSITDDDGVDVTLEAEPQRIVTFAPSMTEIVFALGLGDRLVGVSGPFDDYPAEALEIEEVGGAGEFGVDPNLERVVALEPDLFLTISGGDAWKEQLRELGINVVTLNATDFDDLLADIRTTGLLTGAVDEAELLAADMAQAAGEIEGAASQRVTCFFEVYFGPDLLTVGPNTFIYDLLERAGCDPVTADAASDYPTWSIDDLVADGPQVYFATPESAKSLAQIAKRPGFEAVEAITNGDVFFLDSDLVTRPGPRVVEGLAQISEALAEAAG